MMNTNAKIQNTVFKIYSYNSEAWLVVHFDDLIDLKIQDLISTESFLSKKSGRVYLDQQGDAQLFLDVFKKKFDFIPYMDEIYVNHDHISQLAEYDCDFKRKPTNKDMIKTFIVKEKSGCIYELKTTKIIADELSKDSMVIYVKPADDKAKD